MWSSTFSESFMKIGDYACRAPLAIFWSLHGIALKTYIKLRLHYNELAQRTATVCRYLTFVNIRWYTLKKSDECDHLGLTYRTENEYQTTPERTHNELVANDKRVSTTPQRTPNVLRVLSAFPLRTLCEQCAYRL